MIHCLSHSYIFHVAQGFTFKSSFSLLFSSYLFGIVTGNILALELELSPLLALFLKSSQVIYILILKAQEIFQSWI